MKQSNFVKRLISIKAVTLIGCCFLVSTTLLSQSDKSGKKISPLLFGIFFEDINYSADGGLYAELVQNRSFEYSPTDRREWNPFSYWEYITPGYSYGKISIETSNPIHPNNPHYVVLDIENVGNYPQYTGESGVGIKNSGYDGIVINNGEIVAAGDSREMVDFYKKIITKSDDEKKVADIKNSNYGWKNGFSINAGHDDYGIMSAEIIDFGIFDDKNNPTTCFGSDETVEIRIKIKANKTINNPIAAYSIKDVKGNELVGTNTFYENIPIGAINSDEIVHVTFRQKVPLRGGSYFLSIGCTEFVSGELVVHHRLYDIIVFEVISTRMIPSIVDPHSQIEVSRNV